MRMLAMEERDNPQSDNQQYRTSTSAQRSGGQSQDGQGMGNESFEGSSLGGQTSEPSPTPQDGAALFSGAQPGDSTEGLIDPTTGQIDRGYAAQGQGAEQQSNRSDQDERGQERQNPLDGE